MINNDTVTYANEITFYIESILNTDKNDTLLYQGDFTYGNEVENIVTVKRYGTADFVGRRAVQDAIDSITDASNKKPYTILCDGIFEATQASDFDVLDTVTGNYCFVLPKDNIHIKGTSKNTFFLSGKLPNNLGVDFNYKKYVIINHRAKNSFIENCTIEGENLRYPIHIDSKVILIDVIQKFTNCKVWHKGNTGDALNWGNFTPIGIGMASGQEIYLENCELKSLDNPFGTHTNVTYDKPSLIHLKNCVLRSTLSASKRIIAIQSLGSFRDDKVIFENCVLDNGEIAYNDVPWGNQTLDLQPADHSETQLIVADLLPIPFDNSAMRSRGLKFISKSVGASSIISFTESATAFDIIIGNSLENYEIINRYNRPQIYGYQYKNGGNGLSGYAIGGLDIQSAGVGISDIKYITPLGKRLGDCSIVNKTLTIIIDGITYNIVFNKNYNGTANTLPPNFSNTQIITEITDIIGNFADVEEYSVSADYYPQFKGVLNMVNADASEVLKGMGVVFLGQKTFRKALNSDGYIDGICLDNGIIGDECRVIEKGKLHALNSAQRYSTLEVTNAVRNVGNELGISVSQAGYFDLSASPKVLIATQINVLKIK